MRGNGAVTVGPSIELAVGFAWCLEDAARVETMVRSVSGETEAAAAALSADEIGLRQVSAGAVFERLWDFLAGADAEAVERDAKFLPPQWGTMP